MDKEIIKEKKIEAYLGLLFCLPAMIGVICLLLNMIIGDDTCGLTELGGIWSSIDYADHGWGEYSAYGYAAGAASPTPLFMGLMAIVGAYLLKGNLHYILNKKDKSKNQRSLKPDSSL